MGWQSLLDRWSNWLSIFGVYQAAPLCRERVFLQRCVSCRGSLHKTSARYRIRRNPTPPVRYAPRSWWHVVIKSQSSEVVGREKVYKNSFCSAILGGNPILWPLLYKIFSSGSCRLSIIPNSSLRVCCCSHTHSGSNKPLSNPPAAPTAHA